MKWIMGVALVAGLLFAGYSFAARPGPAPGIEVCAGIGQAASYITFAQKVGGSKDKVKSYIKQQGANASKEQLDWFMWMIDFVWAYKGVEQAKIDAVFEECMKPGA